MSDLVWKSFVPSAAEPRWLYEQPVDIGPPGTVEVTAYKSGWCPAANLVYERAVQVADELGPDVHVSTVDTSDRATLLGCGHADAVFVNGRPLQRGAPPSLRAIRRKMSRELAKMRRKHTT